jgi:outer membrane lipoprotein SlyB
MSRIVTWTAAALAMLSPACATTATTTAAPWDEPVARVAATRTGRVESVQQIVSRADANPADGPRGDMLIGGFLFRGRGPAALIGAPGGVDAGHAARETRTYQVLVHFDDGVYGMFVYGGRYSPFRAGEGVVLTPRGLAHLIVD